MRLTGPTASERICPMKTEGCPNDCGLDLPCKLAETPLHMALDVYWANGDPWLGRRIDKLVEVLREPPTVPSDAPYSFWLGRDAASC